MDSLNILTAFFAGVLSFLSPCVFPLIPSYIAYVGGVSVLSAQGRRGVSLRTVINLLLFILGFSLVFIAFGAGATFIGQFMAQNKSLLAKVAGTVIVIFGLSFMGVFNKKSDRFSVKPNLWIRVLGWSILIAFAVLLYVFLFSKTSSFLMGVIYLTLVSAFAYLLSYFDIISFEFLNYEAKFQYQAEKSTYMTSFILGLSFAFGWTPCIGPILAAIIAMASLQETVWQGITLLAFYSLGLGVPFFVSGILVDLLLKSLKAVRKYFRLIEIIAGVMLVLIGILIYTDLLQQLAYLFPQLDIEY